MFEWSNWRVILLLVQFGVLIIFFAAVQYWQGDSATVPPRILKQRTMASAAWFAFCQGGGFFVVL